VTTCTWVFRRHAGRVILAASVVAATAGLALPRASADQISDLRAQAAALSSRITALGNQEEALSERYDQAVLQVQVLQGKVTQATHQLAAAEATTNKARAALKQDAVDAYVNGNNNPYTSGANAMVNANNSLLRDEYVSTLATDQNDAIDQFHLAALQERQAQKNLTAQTAAAQGQVRQVSQARSAVEVSQGQLQSALNQDTGRISVLVAQQQAAAAAAAKRAAQARLAHQLAVEAAQHQAAVAAQAAAAAQAASRAATTTSQHQATTRSGGGAVTPTNVATPSVPSPPAVAYVAPPSGAGASGAVAAAESRVGDWYSWGAAGPSTFDCSGLVMWAYAQVGISLPHFSGAQYADTAHIPMSDLEPGDLVFPSDPGQHVAMYVGGGMIVEAPHTGATVHVVPLSSWFVLASRVV
jgi:peptidoglycan DL-endopeptidase CwlO